jgi:hypothetical protein
LEETTNALNRARQTDRITLDFNDLYGDLDDARRIYGDAQQSLALNNYWDATAKGQNVQSLLAGINSKLTGAAIEIARKK